MSLPCKHAIASGKAFKPARFNTIAYHLHRFSKIHQENKQLLHCRALTWKLPFLSFPLETPRTRTRRRHPNHVHQSWPFPAMQAQSKEDYRVELQWPHSQATERHSNRAMDAPKTLYLLWQGVVLCPGLKILYTWWMAAICLRSSTSLCTTIRSGPRGSVQVSKTWIVRTLTERAGITQKVAEYVGALEWVELGDLGVWLYSVPCLFFESSH